MDLEHAFCSTLLGFLHVECPLYNCSLFHDIWYNHSIGQPGFPFYSPLFRLLVSCQPISPSYRTRILFWGVYPFYRDGRVSLNIHFDNEVLRCGKKDEKGLVMIDHDRPWMIFVLPGTGVAILQSIPFEYQIYHFTSEEGYGYTPKSNTLILGYATWCFNSW